MHRSVEQQKYKLFIDNGKRVSRWGMNQDERMQKWLQRRKEVREMWSKIGQKMDMTERADSVHWANIFD